MAQQRAPVARVVTVYREVLHTGREPTRIARVQHLFQRDVVKRLQLRRNRVVQTRRLCLNELQNGCTGCTARGDHLARAAPSRHTPTEHDAAGQPRRKGTARVKGGRQDAQLSDHSTDQAPPDHHSGQAPPGSTERPSATGRRAHTSARWLSSSVLARAESRISAWMRASRAATTRENPWMLAYVASWVSCAARRWT